MSIHAPLYIKALPDYRLFLRFADGVEGTVDLSSLTREGVFRRWRENPASFESVRVGDDGSLVWDDGLDLCSDALYLELSGKPIEEVFSRLKSELQHA